jgi:signal peptidase II
MTIKKAYIPMFLAIPFFVLLDQLSKWLVAEYLKGPFWILPNLGLRYAENTGIAWGMAIPFPLLLILNFIMLGLCIYLGIQYLDLRHLSAQMAFGMIVAGAVGNICDRVLHGFVVDFISIWIWPIFNLADAFLCIGIFIILLFYGKIKKTN